MTPARRTVRRRTTTAPPPAAWLEPVPVKARMQRRVLTVRPDARAAAAAAIMRARRVRHLPVVAAGRRLVGIVTDRDLRQVVFDPALQARLGRSLTPLGDVRVRDVMTWAVVAVGPGTALQEAARLMHDKRIGAVPVVEGGRLVGLLTETDVLAAFRAGVAPRVRPVRALRGARGGGNYEYGIPLPGDGDAWQDNGAGD
jgi:CBS domain-containing protein